MNAGAGAARSSDCRVRARSGHVPSHAPALAAVRGVPARQPESALHHQQGLHASCAELPLGWGLVGRVSSFYKIAAAMQPPEKMIFL